MIDIDKLQKLAEAAHQGKWKWRIDEAFMDPTCNDILTEKDRIVACIVHQENAEYIVELHNSLPELLAENKALREEVTSLENRLEALADIMPIDMDEFFEVRGL